MNAQWILNRSCTHRFPVCMQDHCPVHYVVNPVLHVQVSQYLGSQEPSPHVRDHFSVGVNFTIEGVKLIQKSHNFSASQNP